MTDQPNLPEEAVKIARAFHDEYEAFAEMHGWTTQKNTRVAFDDLPTANRKTMIDTVSALLSRGIVSAPAIEAAAVERERERLARLLKALVEAVEAFDAARREHESPTAPEGTAQRLWGAESDVGQVIYEAEQALAALDSLEEGM